jgi:hypothetical protein
MKKNWILATVVAVAVTFGSMAQTTPSQTTPSQTTPSSGSSSGSYGNKKDKKMKKDSTSTYGTQKKDTTNRK